MLDALPDTADRDRVSAGLAEILLDEPLLEPGLFDGYQVADTIVMGTHAGLARSDDPTPDHRRTARLIVPATAGVDALSHSSQVQLTNPDLDGLDVQDQYQQLRESSPSAATPVARFILDGTGTASARAAGGELVIEHLMVRTSPGPVASEPGKQGAEVSVLTARVVGAPRTSGTSTTFLVRLSYCNLLLLRLAELQTGALTRVVRFHAPIIMPATTIGLRGRDGHIRLDLPDRRCFTSLWIMATAIDRRGKESPQIAPPAETRVVNPPAGGPTESPLPDRRLRLRIGRRSLGAHQRGPGDRPRIVEPGGRRGGVLRARPSAGHLYRRCRR